MDMVLCGGNSFMVKCIPTEKKLTMHTYTQPKVESFMFLVICENLVRKLINSASIIILIKRMEEEDTGTGKVFLPLMAQSIRQ